MEEVENHDLKAMTDHELDEYIKILGDERRELQERMHSMDPHIRSANNERYRRKTGISIGDCIEFTENRQQYDQSARRRITKHNTRRMKVKGYSSFGVIGTAIRKDGTLGRQSITLYFREQDFSMVKKIGCPEES